MFNLFRKIQFFLLTGYASYLSLTPSPGKGFELVWDKLLHIICWFVLILSLHLAIQKKSGVVIPAVALFIYSVIIEALQHLIPGRVFSYQDIIANGIGIIAASLVISTYKSLPNQIRINIRTE